MKCKHDNVVSGTGCMGDGMICLDCGLDKYPEAFPTEHGKIRNATPEDWKLINKIRKVIQYV